MVYVVDLKVKCDYFYYSEIIGYWEEYVWENVLSFNKIFGKYNVNVMVGIFMIVCKYIWNFVGVEGKIIVYKVEDGKLVISEILGGFFDLFFLIVGVGVGGIFDGSGIKWKYNCVFFFGWLNYNYNDCYLV